MDECLKKMVRKHHSEVVFLPIEGNGYILHGTHGKLNQIIVNSSLSDEMAEKVILHEIGHLERDQDSKNYKSDYATRVTCEHGANCFLIQEKVKQFVEQGYDVFDANYVDLATSLGTDDYTSVKNELSKYLIE